MSSSEIQPKDKSDSKWLTDAGYKSLHEFMIVYGFKPHDGEDMKDAKKLLAEFRAEQQEEWEAKQKNADQNRIKTSEKDTQLAQLWHRRMGHINYHDLKQTQRVTTGMDDFTFNVDDIPVCASCTAMVACFGESTVQDNRVARKSAKLAKRKRIRKEKLEKTEKEGIHAVSKSNGHAVGMDGNFPESKHGWRVGQEKEMRMAISESKMETESEDSIGLTEISEEEKIV